MEHGMMESFTLCRARAQHPLPGAAFHRYVFEDGTVWTEFHRHDGGYLLRFPKLADFEVSGDGYRVACHPVPGVDEATLEHLFLNQIYPLALTRRGRPAFHAAAVRVGGGAVAFLGASGMGKSTLAMAFARAGFPFLTDDGLLVEKSEEGYRVLPNHPSIRVWDDSRKALAGPGVVIAPALSYTNKARLHLETSAYCDQPQPLLCAYLLAEDGVRNTEIRPIRGASAVMGWIRHSFLLDIQDTAMLNRHFDWAGDISDAVPLYSLDYPRRYAALPRVRQAIIDHAMNAGDQKWT